MIKWKQESGNKSSRAPKSKFPETLNGSGLPVQPNFLQEKFGLNRLDPDFATTFGLRRLHPIFEKRVNFKISSAGNWACPHCRKSELQNLLLRKWGKSGYQ